MTEIEINVNQKWTTNGGEPLPEGMYIVSVESDGETTKMNYIPFDTLVVTLAKAIAEAMNAKDG